MKKQKKINETQRQLFKKKKKERKKTLAILRKKEFKENQSYNRKNYN